MDNQTVNSLSGFIIALALLALLGAGCASTARADSPRLEQALSAALFCYDDAAGHVEHHFDCLDGPAGGNAVCKAKRQRQVFTKCMETFKAGRCDSDSQCAAFFGREY